MSKPKFDVSTTAKKFLSGVQDDTHQTDQKEAEPGNSGKPIETPKDTLAKGYIPEKREIGANRPKGIDKATGEVTRQIGYFVTESQDRKLKQLALDMNTNKSAILREAIRMYFDYLEKEGIT